MPGLRPLIVALLALLAVTAPAQAAAPKVSVALRSLDRASALRAGALKVRVRARRGTRVRISAGALARPRTLRFRRGGGRTTTLRLRPAGRRALRACGPRRLRITVVARRNGGRRRKSTLRRLRGGSPCPGGPGGTTGPARKPEAAGFAVTPGCDELDPAVCLLPFPNDRFTVADPKQVTGRRLAFSPGAMPKNRDGKPIDPADYAFSDGFSPGQLIIAHVPGLDSVAALRATNAPSVDQPQRSLDADSPVSVVDADTGERQLVFAEVDANPADPKDRNLLIRPAKNLTEGHRYVVALRGLRRQDGSAIPAGRAFTVYRDAIPTTSPAVEARRAAMERIFGTLKTARIPRDGSLYLAWDFTVASAPSTTSRLLSIRDRAFAALGDGRLDDLTVQGTPPAYQLNPDIPDSTPQPEPPVDGDLPIGIPKFSDLDGVRDFAPCSAGDPAKCEDGEDDRIARVVRGSFQVPCYLDVAGCAPGGQFRLDPAGRIPQAIPGNVANPNFTCIIPRQAVDPPGAAPLRPSLYGHGLFGGQGEIFQGQLKTLANDRGFVFCATDWDGMATRDVPTALAALQDLSQFPKLIDHVQQGFLHFLYLGRLMIHPDGFAKAAAFRPKGSSVIDTTRLFYDGNSQGGIYGGSLTAVAPDFERAVLGVPGMNYSTLLRRSTDFNSYARGSSAASTRPAASTTPTRPRSSARSSSRSSRSSGIVGIPAATPRT